MSDDLLDRLSAAAPRIPDGLLETDHRVLEEILMTEPTTKRRVVTPLRLSAVGALAAAVVAVLTISAAVSKAPPVSQAARPLNMRRIVASTNAALASGRARVIQTSTRDKGPAPRVTGSDFVVEFSGDNRSMYGTVDPGDGRSARFSIANKIVDGQFYLQDGTRWVKDTNASNLSGGDVFSVDPRNFLAGVADAAQFKQVGTEQRGGVNTRHLEATKLDGIPDFNLGLGPRGETTLTAFELWVDADDVVRGLLVKSEQQEKTYPLAETRTSTDANGNFKKWIDPATLGDPVIVTVTSQYKVEFTDLGAAIIITPPAGAVSVAGKG